MTCRPSVLSNTWDRGASPSDLQTGQSVRMIATGSRWVCRCKRRTRRRAAAVEPGEDVTKSIKSHCGSRHQPTLRNAPYRPLRNAFGHSGGPGDGSGSGTLPGRSSGQGSLNGFGSGGGSPAGSWNGSSSGRVAMSATQPRCEAIDSPFSLRRSQFCLRLFQRRARPRRRVRQVHAWSSC